MDDRSLALHRLVAEKLRQKPELFTRVLQTLGRWRQTVDAASQPYLQAWEQLMVQGVEACLEAACEDSERARALRQCSPFCGVLTHRERAAFFRTHRMQGPGS